jgi:hypothetical protein
VLCVAFVLVLAALKSAPPETSKCAEMRALDAKLDAIAAKLKA